VSQLTILVDIAGLNWSTGCELKFNNCMLER